MSAIAFGANFSAILRRTMVSITRGRSQAWSAEGAERQPLFAGARG